MTQVCRCSLPPGVAARSYVPSSLARSVSSASKALRRFQTASAMQPAPISGGSVPGSGTVSTPESARKGSGLKTGQPAAPLVVRARQAINPSADEIEFG
jgi:hypothetical protein